jgi:hypothetical protein
MFGATNLVIQRENGEQVVRLPRVTDAVGSALRRVYGEGGHLPHEFDRLLHDIDRVSRRHH